MDNRMRILEMIESGEISVAEGVQRLKGSTADAAPDATPLAPPGWVRWLWHLVFWPGVALLIGGGLLLTYHYAGPEGAGRLATGWILFTLGVLVTALGAWLQSAHWFSVCIREHGKPRMTLAFPLPLSPLAWLLRMISPFVPQLRDTGVEVLLALRDEMRQGRPFIVNMGEGEGGERVQVYFG